MSKAAKKRAAAAALAAQKKSTPAPPLTPVPASTVAANAPHSTTGETLVYVPPPRQQCDDELTVIASKLRPQHRKFADLILEGRTGSQAVEGAGFRAADLRSAATRILRREDVRRYIRLTQREVAISNRVTLDALVTHLWTTARDPQALPKVKAAALAHLVRIFTAGGNQIAVEKTTPGTGLSDELVVQLEAKLLGIRQPGPEA
jgi:hypothetical protein